MRKPMFDSGIKEFVSLFPEGTYSDYVAIYGTDAASSATFSRRRKVLFSSKKKTAMPNGKSDVFRKRQAHIHSDRYDVVTRHGSVSPEIAKHVRTVLEKIYALDGARYTFVTLPSKDGRRRDGYEVRRNRRNSCKA